MLPWLILIHIRDDEHNFRLFIPLILVFIILLPLIVLALAVLILLTFIPGAAEARRWMQLAFYSPKILAAARGMEVKIRSNDADVYFRII